MKTMTRRPFVYITGFYSLGIVLNHLALFPFGYFCLLTFIFLVISAGISKRTFASTVFLMLAVTGLGAVYAQSRQCADKNHIMHVAKYYRKKPVKMKGVVVSDIQERKSANGFKTTFTLDVREVEAKWGWQEKKGRILVNIFRDSDVVYGDYVCLEGKMHRPFEFSTDSTFSYRDYLNRKGIELILSVKKDGHVEVIETNRGNPFKARSLRIKSRLTGVLSQYLSKNEAAIMQAVLLGDRYNIPSHIRNLFQLCGVSHILAISGLHLGIVAFLVFLFLKMIPMPRRIRYVLVIVLLVFYAFLTGSRPSVVRAMIMVGVFLASFIIERESEIYNTLSLAALMILLINPLHLFDVGFQLSFASVFSIIYFCPKWMHGFSGWDLKSRPGFIRYLAQSFVVSLAAFTGVAGLIAYYFHIITPIAVLANLVVIPLTSAAIALGMGLLFVGVALPAAAPLFAACLKLLLNLTAAGTFLFAQVPGAYFQVGNVPLWGVIIYYILLFLGMYWRFAKSVSKEIDKRAGV